MLRLLVLIAAIVALSSTTAVTDDRPAMPVPVLVDRAKKAFAEQDKGTFEDLMYELFERTTGFNGRPTSPLKGTPDALYMQAICDFDRVVERVLTPEGLLDIVATAAYGVALTGKKYKDHFQLLTDCVWDDGRKVSTNQLLSDGTLWAKKLRAANANEFAAVVQENKTLSDQFPRNKEYKIRALVLKLQAEEIRSRALLTEAEKRHAGEIARQAKLVAKAYLGDLASQMKVARVLEARGKREHDNSKAYLWYKCAVQNGGGKEAQDGMDRLFPHLSEIDLGTVEEWMQNNGRPF